MTHKFNNNETKLIFRTLQKLVQIKSTIEQLSVEREVYPSDLPMSVIPTDVLYETCVCYELMYNKLLEKILLEEGYPKTKKTYYH